MSEASDKGTALELAVGAIESAILRSSPSFNDKTFRIESNKVFEANRVRHEIDIWVDVDLAPSYNARFIFECKNWQEKVGKNDVIVLSEKIRATLAQRGFLVAREFTADAEAQAGLDQRIELLRVADLPVQDVPMPLALHGISVEATTAQVEFARAGSELAESQRVRMPVDMEHAVVLLKGQQVPLPSFFDPWITAERDRRVSSFPSGAVSDGVHELAIEAERTFGPGEFILDGHPIAKATLRGTVQVRVSSPVIISHFAVGERGRAITVALQVGKATIQAAFAALPSLPGAGQ